MLTPAALGGQVAVAVGVIVGELVTVLVAVLVGGTGVLVLVLVFVGEFVAREALVAVGVLVIPAVNVLVGLRVLVGVRVRVLVRVLVGCGVLVIVGVRVTVGVSSAGPMMFTKKSVNNSGSWIRLLFTLTISVSRVTGTSGENSQCILNRPGAHAQMAMRATSKSPPHPFAHGA